MVLLKGGMCCIGGGRAAGVVSGSEVRSFSKVGEITQAGEDEDKGRAGRAGWWGFRVFVQCSGRSSEVSRACSGSPAGPGRVSGNRCAVHMSLPGRSPPRPVYTDDVATGKPK